MKLIHLLFCAAIIAGCKDEINRSPDLTYQPDISAARFPDPTTITNPYFPIEAGKKYIYEGQTDEGLEHIEEYRLNETRVVNGITCVIVNFKAYINNILVEEANDWYAQDIDGTVWYFGEEVDNYANGQVVNHNGSWESGVDDAKAGIIMPVNPAVGFKYREEYYFNEAEDEAEVVETGLEIITPLDTFTNVILTRNWTELEPDVVESKFYAPGFGLIKELEQGGSSTIYLVRVE